jgi:LPXTG-motif cell wall-anchored protein
MWQPSWTALAQAPVPGGDKLVMFGAIGVVVLLLLVALVFRRRKKHNPEGGLTEDLGQYPSPPRAGGRRLLVQGHPMRLRLVVIAPVGKKEFAKDGDIEPVLDEVVPGMGEVAEVDRPRVRIWPPQLSVPGFPPSFWRLTHRPHAQTGNWVLVAGSAKASGQPILLGLALWSDKPTKMSQIVLQPQEWADQLRVD